MKYYVKMQVAFNSALNQLKSKKGQGTVEYLLMLGVIVGVALAAAAIVNKIFPDLTEGIKQKIMGGVSSL